MHQTFYIDIDEEITSVIDRLHHAKAGEIIMVVPKRALLIQSIVNLRILKKESDEAGIQLMMVTQDKLGKILIEKAGIFVQQKMDNIADEEISLQEEKISENRYEMTEEDGFDKKDGRLNSIGSENYFDDKSQEEIKVSSEKVQVRGRKSAPVKINKEGEGEQLINKELVTGIGSDIRRKQSEADINFGISRETAIPVRTNPKKDAATLSEISAIGDLKKSFPPQANQSDRFYHKAPDFVQDKKVEGFFHSQNNFERRQEAPRKKDFEEYGLPKKTHKWFWIFGIFSAALVFGILLFLFIPRADVTISVKTSAKSVDSEVTGNINVDSLDYDKNIIPARIVTLSQEITKDVNATGKKSVSNQKARGLVTIYNEYDSNPQPLVATTRFLDEGGKLFRLTKGVTIPGMTNEGPGSVEAEVVADQPGEEYNIGPAKFTIPGFESSGNNKYNKFYAKSEKTMTGGGKGVNESNFITAGDIAEARSQMSAELENVIKQKVKEEAGGDAVVIDGVIDKADAVYKLSNSEGDVADSFRITAETKAKVMVVNEKDLRSMVARMITKVGTGGKKLDEASIIWSFGKPNVDFDGGIIGIKFHASGKMSSDLDTEVVKADILGKNEEGLRAYLESFPDVEKAEVVYRPSFMNSRIPFRAAQVNVTLDKQ